MNDNATHAVVWTRGITLPKENPGDVSMLFRGTLEQCARNRILQGDLVIRLSDWRIVPGDSWLFVGEKECSKGYAKDMQKWDVQKYGEYPDDPATGE